MAASMQAGPSKDPFALDNLLPVGSTYLAFDHETISRNPNVLNTSESSQSYSDWSSLPTFIEGNSSPFEFSSIQTYKEIDFLHNSRFLRAIWCLLKNARIHVRLYLIPFDLVGAKGALTLLRRQQSGIMNSVKENSRSLLFKACSSLDAWNEGFFPEEDEMERVLPIFETDPRSLAEIYSELPSPVVDPDKYLFGLDTQTQTAFRSALDWRAPPGMRSTLYPYQRRTVARMLQQELDPGDAPDPLYIPIYGITEDSASKVFYFQPTTMELLCAVPRRSQAKGGILCEEMGSGKTCIVLALILATKHQISIPEEEWGEPPKPILTLPALCHFPSQHFKEEREKAHMKEQGCEFPSLVEILMHHLRTSPGYFGPRELSIDSHLADTLEKYQPFYHVYQHDPSTGRAAAKRRKIEAPGPRRVYLTSASLIVVPRSLLEQWISEIYKHCEDNQLRVYIPDKPGRSNSKLLPDAAVLANDYDIVLLTHERFSAETDRCDFSEVPFFQQKLKKRESYCNTVDDSSDQTRVSPLIQIRWKRLVVDEGHVTVAANKLAYLCSNLNVERRWIVTGTPTRNLMGLSLGQSIHSPTPDGEAPDDFSQETASPTPVAPEIDEDSELEYPGCYSANIWPQADSEDLRRFRLMLSRFLRVPQFVGEVNSKTFLDSVISPVMDREGPRFGSIQLLTQVMSSVMFRHRIEDIERDLPVKLPPLVEEVAHLKFHPLAAKTYNLQQAAIAVNAVDSERTDRDYLFDGNATSRKYLANLLQNITQAMFWKWDDERLDVVEGTERATESLERAVDRGRPQEDIELLEDAIRVHNEALEDQLWNEIIIVEECPFAVQGLSDPVQESWSNASDEKTSFLSPSRLLRLRNAVIGARYASDPESKLEAQGDGARWEDQQQQNLKELDKQHKRKSASTEKFSATENSKEKQLEVRRELHVCNPDVERWTVPDAFTSNTSFDPIPTGPLGGYIPKISVGNSVSSKLNYIMKEVLEHSPHEKFIIFSAFPVSLYCIAEALRVANISYLAYMTAIDLRARQDNVITFETSEKHRVFLMELKYGARGLNLVKASRIIFCEPVWHADVEAQAIKRAHRIGQTCTVLKVTTLVMEGTSEELIISRRKTLQNKAQKRRAFQEDEGLRKFLQNPKFLQDKHIDHNPTDVLNIPLIPAAEPTDAQDTEVDIAKPVARPLSREIWVDIPPAKKRKVHFA